MQTVAVAQMRPTVHHNINYAALQGKKPVKIPRQVTDTNGPLRPAPAPAPLAVPQPASWGTPLGFTTYDLMTNRAVANRIAMSGNTVSASWILSCQLGSAPGYTNRGIGYNASTNAGAAGSWANGPAGNCPSTFGVGSARTGWPEIAHTPNNEIIISHSGSGLVMNKRAAIGSGAWSANQPLTFTGVGAIPGGGASSGTWPRMMTSGNTIHLVYCSNGSTTAPQNPSGVINPVNYARSQDGGVTWDKQNINLPQFDSTNLSGVGGDQYAIGVNGNTVAVATGAFGDNLLIAKSTDGGTTFTTRVIQGPFHMSDIVTVNSDGGVDTAVVTSDGSMGVVVDATGTVHYFTGTQLIQVERDSVDRTRFIGTGTYFPDAVTEMWYWNDRELASSQPIVIAELDPEVITGNGFSTLASPSDDNGGRQPYSVTGPVSMPTAIADAATGDVYCIYAGGRLGSTNSGDSTGQYFRDLYLLKLSFNSGQVVQYVPKNISRDMRGVPLGAASQSEESVYPSAVHMVMGNKIHYQWMSDFEPGQALNPASPGPDPEVESAIMYDNIDLNLVAWNLAGVKNNVAAYVAGVSAVPNPTTGETTLNVDLKQAATATVVVRNMLGQEVLRLPASRLQVGANALRLDLSKLTSGMYFYTIQGEKFSLTQRVVKN